MITNPLIIIALLLAIVLVVPMVCRKIRIPSIVGFIIVGCIVGLPQDTYPEYCRVYHCGMYRGSQWSSSVSGQRRDSGFG